MLHSTVLLGGGRGSVPVVPLLPGSRGMEAERL